MSHRTAAMAVAAVDPQAHQSSATARCDDDEIAGHHRVVYFGYHEAHSPRRRQEGHHRHHRRGKGHSQPKNSGHDRRRKNSKFLNAQQNGDDSSPSGSDSQHEAPSERVKFIIGEDKDTTEIPAVFTELEELHENKDHEMVWKETARWIKFEEDIEHAGDKWSKPHVATLSLHSLFELRHCILKGNVILDLEACTLEQIAGVVLDHMINSRQLEEIHRQRVLETILLKHSHYGGHHHHHGHHHKSGLLQAIRGSFHRHLDELEQPTSRPGSHGSLKSMQAEASEEGDLKLDGPHRMMSSASGFSHQSKEPSLMKKLPPGSEASNVLVGELDFLKEPVIAFVRLLNAEYLGDLTEVPLPTRFIFLLLGPTGSQQANHEVGRSISTLMSDPVFHDVAYKAKSREDVLAGIDVFLDQVVVLPPGEWDPTIRLEPPKHIPSAEEMKKSYSHPPLPSAIDKDKQHGHGQHQHPAEGAGSGDGNGGGRGRGGDVNGSAMADRSKESADDGVDPTLKRTGRWFGGLVADVKRKAKVYKSDFTDIFSLQIISSIIFIYFAVISPAITFGGLMGEKTHNYQAAFESVLSVFITGVVWSFTAGQPLIKLGPTGPMLVFEEILYSFCKDQDNLDYLSFRFWIGVWTTILCLILVATDASALVQYVTRFTEETFSVLISLIFIYEALKKLVEIGIDYDFEPCVDCNITCDCISTKNGSSLVMFTAVESKNLCKAFGIANNLTMENKCPDHFREVFFLSILLMFGTFFMVTCLKSFKETPYFSSRARQIISDYSVIIAIMVWLVVDIIFDANTPKLTVPDEFRPTLHLKRGFVVNPVPSGFPAWAIFAAILPALLLTMLVFMDQQITAIIVNRKENKLKKGAGYHLDLFVVAIMFFVCSLLGLPWVVAATVQSVTHINSLQVFSKTRAPGEQAKFLGIREQRVTSVAVSVLVGLSLLMTPLLNVIPMPILYGLFLYMGVSSLRGVQFVERLSIIFMPAKYQPDRYYIRHVPNKKIHLFTIIQLICLAALCVIKLTEAGIVLALVVVALVLVRRLMSKLFSKEELEILDDQLPEFVKRKRADEKKKEKNKDSDGLSPSAPSNNSIHINISTEVDQCSVWKHLHEDSQTRIRKRNLGYSQSPILEHPEVPEVVIDPPSQRTSVDASLQKTSVDVPAFHESSV